MGPSKKCWFWCNGPSTTAPQIPLRHQKTFHLALFLSNLAILKSAALLLKSAALFQGLNWPPKSRKKLIGALSCMHKGPKCIQSLWDHPKKIPFVQKHKEGAICAILREKTPFLAFPEAKNDVVNYARLWKSAHWPKNNANPSGLSEKKVYCVEGRDMCDP